MFFISLNFVVAESCDIDVTLINQDPYPAIPGNYVKLVFQVNGIDNPQCGVVKFSLLEQYPIIFDPDFENEYQINAGTYKKDYNSFFLASYKIRIDENALNGATPIKINYNVGGNLLVFEEEFNIEIDDSRADFEIYVKDYDLITQILTFEILNIAESDIEALTLEIPKQEGVVIKGAKTNIIGDLDSNEYTTADFEALPSEGEISIKVSYTDATNVRRTLVKDVLFEPEYFEDRADGKEKKGFGTYLLWTVILGIICYFIYGRYKKKKAMKNKLRRK